MSKVLFKKAITNRNGQLLKNLHLNYLKDFHQVQEIVEFQFRCRFRLNDRSSIFSRRFSGRNRFQFNFQFDLRSRFLLFQIVQTFFGLNWRCFVWCRNDGGFLLKTLVAELIHRKTHNTPDLWSLEHLNLIQYWTES